jgi:putative membrane-bound dehydrogenase-like protein
MTVADGLKVRLVASEPMIRQPVAIEFDDRGRPWVIQYLQYPNPAGLSRVTVDRYSRTTYDRVPEPPPRGPKGSDRITILEDTDGDGRADRSKDFLTGLNLASGLAFGRGGVFVLQAPYLLFYPDRDRDDVPDSQPEVLLTGFGMEDAHSVANSLTWGPDGWLYGLQGSTVTARIRGIEFQQGVWRYHPESKRFELYSEGGGNMWGLDFDRRGNLFASTNVGGFVMLHARPGAYYWKSFGKHGPLHNPYAYGHFDHVPHDGLRGGHVSVGGLFYEADALPDRFRGRYIAADLLGHAIHWHELIPHGSTFRARQVGDLLVANDTWFAPSDLTLGPDGSLYVTDWHDKRTAHPDPDADWDRSNGRIYAVDGPGSKPIGRIDLLAASSAELVAMLNHPNVWHVRRARRILSERKDGSVVPTLTDRVVMGRGVPALESLWALHGCGGFDTELAAQLLDHPDEDIRAWTVRLLGDEETPQAPLGDRLVALAATEPSVVVRAALAGVAIRQESAGPRVAEALLGRDEDAEDPHLPLLLWWAVERHADHEGELAGLIDGPWDSKLVRETILPRLARRSAARSQDDRVARMLASARTDEDRGVLLASIEGGLRGRRPEAFAGSLKATLDRLSMTHPDDSTLLRIRARAGDPSALDRLRSLATDPEAPEPSRLAAIDVIADLADPSWASPLRDLAVGDVPATIQAAALKTLARFEELSVADALLAAYPSKDAAWRARARDVLLVRREWAGSFLRAVDRGEIPAAEVPLDQVGRVANLGDPTLDALARKHWGKVASATPESKLAEVRRLNNDLNSGPGDFERGRALFREHCANCHRLFGEGRAVGPELTHANRGDRQFLLVSLVDPGGVVRKEYQATVVQTRDGRVLSGLLAEQTPTHITLLGALEEKTTIRRDEVEDQADSPSSLMPEDLYHRFSPGDLRDLFRYLQSDPSAVAP